MWTENQPRAYTVTLVDTVVRVESVAVSGGGIASRSDSTPPSPDSIGDTSASPDDLGYLRSRQLLIPVANVARARLPNTFDESRAGGTRRHDALDILAPRGTAVLSADTGRITKLFTSDAGGLTIYATDPSERFVYYCAHLERYDAKVREGMTIRRGDTIAYVGTSGNAPANTPHLHFAVMKLADPKRWWDGTAINPYPLFVGP